MEKCQKMELELLQVKENYQLKIQSLVRKITISTKRITKYARRIKSLSDFKTHFPRIAKLLYINRLMARYEKKQAEQVKSHQNKKI